MRFLITLAACLFRASAAGAENWPDFSRPASAIGGGEQDAALVVGVESYGFVAPVAGAEANAKAWYDYLTRTRGAGPANVRLLLGEDATREEILEAAQAVAAKAGPKGTLWFVFIGHGAPSADGQDGLLVGVDAQQKASSLQKRSVKRQELLAALASSRAGAISVILDACFSGRSPDGSSLAPGLQPLVTVAAAGAVDPRMVVLTAAKGNQFAGPLPGGARPAFSYLALGALRGWAAEKAGPVTAGGIWRYASGALEATLRGRNQTPDLMGKEDAVVGVSAGEKAPDLAALAKATAGGGTDFQVTSLAAVPRAKAPKALDASGVGLDFGGVDVDALEKYDAASEFDKGGGAAEDKAEAWRNLAASAPAFAALAEKRAEEWDAFAAQSAAAEAAKVKRVEARDLDWGKLSRLLALKIVPSKDKERWSAQFAAAYIDSPGLEPEMAKGLTAHVAPGPSANALKALAAKAPNPGASARRDAPAIRVVPGKAGIQWVSIPGGTFMMGSSRDGESPVHAVAVKSFQMAKTEVTNKQYRACVEAGVCASPKNYRDGFNGDDHPVVGLDWVQAKKFSEWAGGRLPTEAEWEYAARSLGKDRVYAWGDAEPTCSLASFGGCRNETSPVCSTPAGNTEQGLCDMTGNVWEWIQDRYHVGYYDAPTDGSAWEPSGSERMERGGYWYAAAEYLRTTARSSESQTSHGNGFGGFRPVR